MWLHTCTCACVSICAYVFACMCMWVTAYVLTHAEHVYACIYNTHTYCMYIHICMFFLNHQPTFHDDIFPTDRLPWGGLLRCFQWEYRPFKQSEVTQGVLVTIWASHARATIFTHGLSLSPKLWSRWRTRCTRWSPDWRTRRHFLRWCGSAYHRRYRNHRDITYNILLDTTLVTGYNTRTSKSFVTSALLSCPSHDSCLVALGCVTWQRWTMWWTLHGPTGSGTSK